MITFEIPGEPKGKGRPRFGNGIAYTPDETRDYEMYVKQCYLNSQKKINLTENPIKIRIVANYKIPSSFSKKKRSAAMSGVIKPTKKPDCDNIIKIICDALNLVAYKDDKQIVECSCIKRYATDIPCVDVFVEELDG